MRIGCRISISKQSRERVVAEISKQQMAEVKAAISSPLKNQQKVFTSLDISPYDCDDADESIEDIDEDTWVAAIRLSNGSQLVYAKVRVEIWGQGGGHFTAFYGFSSEKP